MEEVKFKEFLQKQPTITSKDHAVNRRIGFMKNIEKTYKLNIDDIITNDDEVYSLITKLKADGDEKQRKQNALRYYYLFINNKKYPSSKELKLIYG